MSKMSAAPSRPPPCGRPAYPSWRGPADEGSAVTASGPGRGRRLSPGLVGRSGRRPCRGGGALTGSPRRVRRLPSWPVSVAATARAGPPPLAERRAVTSSTRAARNSAAGRPPGARAQSIAWHVEPRGPRIHGISLARRVRPARWMTSRPRPALANACRSAAQGPPPTTRPGPPGCSP